MNRAAESIPKRKRWPRVMVIQMSIVAGFLALVWFSFGQNVLDPQAQLVVPQQLGTLELIGSVEGSQALEQVTRLHGTDIDLQNAYIAEYARGNERATVWVGTAGSEEAAAELTRRMVEGIKKGGSGFSNLQRLAFGGLDVYRVKGPGGEHFFYVSRKLRKNVVWLTVDAVDATSLVERAVNIY
jgi:hypothetical protein